MDPQIADELLRALTMPQNIGTMVVFGVLTLVLLGRRVPAASWGGPFISVGILGTFFGILLALLGFDTGDIDASVPALLDGMKTAFLSSVVGMGVAVLTRIWDLAQKREDGPSGPSGEQFIAVMREQRDVLAEIRKGVGGDGDRSLLTQVQLTRNDLGELKTEMKGIRTDLGQFMEAMSKQSTEAIIEALQSVIRDFNSQLNQQFGDNFKQLNQGVERLVGWMDQHQQLIEQSHRALIASTGNLQRATDALSATASSVEQIKTGASDVVGHMRESSGVVEETRARLHALSGDAGTLAANTDALHGAVQQLSTANQALGQSLDAWTGLAGESESATRQITEMVRSVEQHAEAVQARHAQLVGQLRAATDALAADLAHTQQRFFQTQREQMVLAVNKQGEALQVAHREVMEQTRTDLRQAGERNRETIEAQVAALDRALQEELTKALQEIGGMLASLSHKFAADYRPLTEQLARVVRLAEQVEAQKHGRRRV